MTAVKSSSVPKASNRWLQQGAGSIVVLELDIADAAGDDYDVTVDDVAVEVIDCVVIKSGAGAGNTLQVKNGATAITDAIAAAVDKAVTRAGSIDLTQSTILRGGTLRMTVTRTAGSGAMRVLIYALVKTTANAMFTAP